MCYKADYHGTLTGPSRVLRTPEAGFPNYDDLRFDRHSSFSTDLANIGYKEIVAHEYAVYIDGKRQKPVALLTIPLNQRLTLKTQQRHTIDMQGLYVESAGFRKVRIEVSATTLKPPKKFGFSLQAILRS